jgi:hypothetical protein
MSNRRITVGDVYADVLLNWSTWEWIYVVQSDTSHALIAMGTCQSEAEAVRIATETVHQYRAHAVNAAMCQHKPKP